MVGSLHRLRSVSILSSFLISMHSTWGYQPEMLLVTLLARFRFSATNEHGEIVWNLSQILSPSVRFIDGSERKGLPLIVERL